MRRLVVGSVMVGVLVCMMTLPYDSVSVLPRTLADYYRLFFFRDTGAANAVASIYLNYRVFDTIFEALLLLVSIIGIIHFSRHEGDL